MFETGTTEEPEECGAQRFVRILGSQNKKQREEKMIFIAWIKTKEKVLESDISEE